MLIFYLQHILQLFLLQNNFAYKTTYYSYILILLNYSINILLLLWCWFCLLYDSRENMFHHEKPFDL